MYLSFLIDVCFFFFMLNCDVCRSILLLLGGDSDMLPTPFVSLLIRVYRVYRSHSLCQLIWIDDDDDEHLAKNWHALASKTMWKMNKSQTNRIKRMPRDWHSWRPEPLKQCASLSSLINERCWRVHVLVLSIMRCDVVYAMWCGCLSVSLPQ